MGCFLQRVFFIIGIFEFVNLHYFDWLMCATYSAALSYFLQVWLWPRLFIASPGYLLAAFLLDGLCLLVMGCLPFLLKFQWVMSSVILERNTPCWCICNFSGFSPKKVLPQMLKKSIWSLGLRVSKFHSHTCAEADTMSAKAEVKHVIPGSSFRVKRNTEPFFEWHVKHISS